MQAYLAEHDAVTAVAAALARISGHIEVRSRSLVSGTEGLTALRMEYRDEIRSPSLVYAAIHAPPLASHAPSTAPGCYQQHDSPHYSLSHGTYPSRSVPFSFPSLPLPLSFSPFPFRSYQPRFAILEKRFGRGVRDAVSNIKMQQDRLGAVFDL